MPEVKPVLMYLESSHYQHLNGHPVVLGLDTEMLVEADGRIIHPHQIKLPQERPAPSEVSVWRSDRGDWHGDGYAFEMCTIPFSCIDQGMFAVGHTLTKLYNVLREDRYNYRFKGVDVVMPTIYEVSADIVATAPEHVRLLGCMPSFNVYDDPAEPKGLAENERTTGFHMHVSHPSLTAENSDAAIMWADIFCGATWTAIAPGDPKIEARRRQCYGRAGEHRKNIYPSGMFGFEYRTLPGSVLSSPVYMTLMLNLLRHAVSTAVCGTPPKELSNMARIAINEADGAVALEVLKQLPKSAASDSILRRLFEIRFNPTPLYSLATMYGSYYGHRTWFQSDFLNLKLTTSTR